MNPIEFNFPVWLRITHWVNAVFIIFLIRSGIQILSDHPKLYFRDDSKDGSEWIKFGRKMMPKNKLWTSMDETENVSPLIALPGGEHNLGNGRRWHFLAASTWLVNGFVYVILLFATGLWVTIVPTSWKIIPDAFSTFLSYATFTTPPPSAFTPFDPLQKLTYFAVVFILVPLQILTSLAMSPAFIGRYPWYPKLFGGRQAARSIHFIVMISLVLFILGHIFLVMTVGFPKSLGAMTVGHDVSKPEGLGIFAVILIFLVLINVWASWYTLRDQRRWQLLVDRFLDPVISGLFGTLVSRQNYTEKDISLYHRINGYPPDTAEWVELAKNDFENWRLRIGGMVEEEIFLSLAEIKSLPKTEYIAKHNCIQGWSAVAKWGGAGFLEIVKLVKIKKGAKYAVFYGYDKKEDGQPYYESLPLKQVMRPQTILAYEMNGTPLPREHGAPLRLRAESKLGFKMVKYLVAIEFLADIKGIGKGQGGYKEDNLFYDSPAEI